MFIDHTRQEGTNLKTFNFKGERHIHSEYYLLLTRRNSIREGDDKKKTENRIR